MTPRGPRPADEPTHSPPHSPHDVEAARSGDRAAFSRLYHAFLPVVHAIALSHAPRPADAEDIAQEVFSKALARLGDLRDPAAFPGWISAIARNTARDRRPAATQPTEHPAPPAATPLELSESAARALDAVRALPEAYRETLILRLVEGLTGPMIAQRTGLTEGSVRVNLCRGMALLRERLSQGGFP